MGGFQAILSSIQLKNRIKQVLYSFYWHFITLIANFELTDFDYVRFLLWMDLFNNLEKGFGSVLNLRPLDAQILFE